MTENPIVTYRSMPPDAPEFVGPVCVECRYRTPGNNPAAYTCDAFPREMIRPRQRHPITGEVHAAWYSTTYCADKNALGECDRFEAKADTALVQLSRPGKIGRGNGTTANVGVGWVRRLAARLGGWLVRWAESRGAR